MDPMGCESFTEDFSVRLLPKRRIQKPTVQVNSCHMGPSFALMFFLSSQKQSKNETILVI